MRSADPGGDEENRTLNPRLAKAVLCQLSYVPGSPARRRAEGGRTSLTGGRGVTGSAGGLGRLVPERGLGGRRLTTTLDKERDTAEDCEQQQDLLHVHHPTRHGTRTRPVVECRHRP